MREMVEWVWIQIQKWKSINKKSNKKPNGSLASNTDINRMRKCDNAVLEERTQNIPIEVNVNVVNERKFWKKVKGKTGKKKITSRGDHDVKIQQEIRYE